MLEIVLHLDSEEPLLGELDEMPDPTDQTVIIHNPRRRDGKPLHYLLDNVTTLIFPWHRVNFVQILPGEEQMEEIIGFVRE